MSTMIVLDELGSDVHYYNRWYVEWFHNTEILLTGHGSSANRMNDFVKKLPNHWCMV